MGTLYAIYVRLDDAETAAALQAEYPSAYTESNTRFYAIDDPPCGCRPPEAELCRLSSQLGTDVLWLTFQSLADAFEYHHWRSGVHLRSLVFGCYGEERTWERSEGEPEPWEEGAFFNSSDLAFWSEGATVDERRAYERIWATHSLAPGQAVPSLDARETARKVAEFYRLPGWYLDEEAESP